MPVALTSLDAIRCQGMMTRRISLQKIIMLASLVVFVVALAGLYLSFRPNAVTLPGSSKNPGVLGFMVPERIETSQPFSVKVQADTLGSSVNAVGVYINFDPRYLRITQMNSIESFCQFYPEKKFDNNLGTINLACGSPHPGFKGASTILEIEFMPLLAGTTTLRMSENSRMLVSDGKGTNILKTLPAKTLTIVSSI